MMYYISLAVEYNCRIKRYIEENSHRNCIIFTNDDVLLNKNDKRIKYVITEYNEHTINNFLKQGKKIIIYDTEQSNIKDRYKNNNRIMICTRREDIINQINKSKKSNYRLYKKLAFSGALLIIVCILMFVAIGKQLTKEEKRKLEQEKTKIEEKEKKQKEINKQKLKVENIILFGDSITDYYDLEKYYGDYPIINRGTAGYQTKDLLNEIDDRIIPYNPTKVFILVGTNDIAFTDLSDKEIADNIIEIAKKIKNKRSKTEIYIESIYPISKEDNDVVQDWMVGERDNTRIKSINSKLKKLCKQEEFNYIDFYNLLVNEDDNLDVKYTKDGLHMNDKGYILITKEIKKYISDSL